MSLLASPPACPPAAAPPWDLRVPLLREPFAGCDEVLVVSAHPDDETIGAGRLLAGLDVPVRAVTLTAGERCFGDLADPHEVSALRLAEWRCALGELGVVPALCAHLPDGSLGDHEPTALDLLSTLVLPGQGLLAPWRHDPHPDHAAAGRVAATIAAGVGVPLLEYVVWAPWWTDATTLPQRGARLHEVPAAPADHTRRDRALGCFTSQLTPWRPGWPAVVPPDAVARHHAQWVVRHG